MDKKIFSELTSEELKTLYAEILKAREDGVRPRVLDTYIRQVQAIYPLTFGEAWETHRAAVLGRSCQKIFRATIIKKPIGGNIICIM